MKKIKLSLVLALLFISLSCTDARRSKFGGFGDEFLIEVISCDGSVSRTYESTGKVLSERNSDGYYFEDKETGKLVEITGRIIITKK